MMICVDEAERKCLDCGVVVGVSCEEVGVGGEDLREDKYTERFEEKMGSCYGT